MSAAPLILKPKFLGTNESDLDSIKEVHPLSRIAYHEAGHAIACIELGIKVNDISIIANDKTSGRVNVVQDFIVPDLDASERNDRKVEKYIIAALAGAASERKMFGSSDEQLCANDFQVAFDLAIKQCGSMRLTNAYMDYLNLQAESIFSYIDEKKDNDTAEWSKVVAVTAYLLKNEMVSGSKARSIAKKAH